MKLPENTVILYVDDLTKLLGPGPLKITTPQFDRDDGVVVPVPDFSEKAWVDLPNLPKETLKALGCQIWEETDLYVHWLFPGEWYAHIPAGLVIAAIDGEVEKFVPGKTDNDTRYGALAYGFLALKDLA